MAIASVPTILSLGGGRQSFDEKRIALLENDKQNLAGARPRGPKGTKIIHRKESAPMPSRENGKGGSKHLGSSSIERRYLGTLKTHF